MNGAGVNEFLRVNKNHQRDKQRHTHTIAIKNNTLHLTIKKSFVFRKTNKRKYEKQAWKLQLQIKQTHRLSVQTLSNGCVKPTNTFRGEFSQQFLLSMKNSKGISS